MTGQGVSEAPWRDLAGVGVLCAEAAWLHPLEPEPRDEVVICGGCPAWGSEPSTGWQVCAQEVVTVGDCSHTGADPVCKHIKKDDSQGFTVRGRNHIEKGER